MGRIKRGGYFFEFWVGDHPPRHVHVFKNGRLLAKISLRDFVIMDGRAGADIIRILKKLKEEGLI